MAPATAQSHRTEVSGNHSAPFTCFNDYLTASLAIRARLAGVTQGQPLARPEHDAPRFVGTDAVRPHDSLLVHDAGMEIHAAARGGYQAAEVGDFILRSSDSHDDIWRTRIDQLQAFARREHDMASRGLYDSF